MSPKSSPKAAPKEAPKSKKPAPRPAPSGKEIEEASKKAIQMIKDGLTANPEAQAKGYPYIPTEWPMEMKPILGAYRKFVESCSCFRIVQGDQPAKYTVQVTSGKDTSEAIIPPWELELQKAWMKYLQCTPKKSRSPEEFIGKAKAVTSATGMPKAAEGKKKEGGGQKRKVDKVEDAPSAQNKKA
eukprot:CAMPEP_0197687232 /NCGR_PEP_ID=MMETSP1338-20131121/103693_1 /TAXON_ID=43686 ORGANISM="Pelagodinium beii, Strain RCC1491" /NCGR_SAMPLE_ID=MMETSP1338 /ASSEMBLY_ACC=CAM_ASM_000754 /LENGTH=184 /DNA_ID=CAMNT_0043269301 /DNA_START=45 /DNA_END=596 /DNA_ORIENTATION=+